MSHYPRGIVEGVIRYCEIRRSAQFNGGARYRTPWCHIPNTPIVFAQVPKLRQEMVTCLRCLDIRRKR